MILVQVIVALLGLMWLYVGSLQLRVWKQSAGESRVVRRSVGALAASRVIAGLACLAGGIFASWPLIICSAACLLAGNLAAEYAKRQLV